MNDLINLGNVGNLTKPADTLVKKISNAVGDFFEPRQIIRVAEAKAEAAKIEAQSEIEITDLGRNAGGRLTTIRRPRRPFRGTTGAWSVGASGAAPGRGALRFWRIGPANRSTSPCRQSAPRIVSMRRSVSLLRWNGGERHAPASRSSGTGELAI